MEVTVDDTSTVRHGFVPAAPPLADAATLAEHGDGPTVGGGLPESPILPWLAADVAGQRDGRV
ncbi:hypothetical protein STBA_01210 [Streptomyces sp. MP131-18]|nr:hypothetical protein STBA_01210 [Streptomyces sp. MP131-18]